MKRSVRIITVLFLLMAICLFSVSACYANEPVLIEAEIEEEISVKGGKTADEAAAQFIDRVMSGAGKAVGMRGAAGYAALGEREKRLYNQLKPLITATANGQNSSTEFAVPISEVFEKDTYSYDEVEEGATELPEKWLTKLLDIPKVMDALLADCPYDLYWFNKTKGYSYGTSGGYYPHWPNSDSPAFKFGDYENGTVNIKMYVGSEYALNGNLLACDPTWGQAANAAAETARGIVTDNASLGDVAKLTAYKTAICSLTDYNTAAAGGGAAYGNPWQMIWVFDNNTETKVVCEGYSKAFQFLCDESSFQSSNIKSIIASGVMAGGTGAGRHMWNIVTLEDGKKYLADITNSDAGTVGSGGGLFLTRCSETREYTYDGNGLTYNAYVFPAGNMEILYGYDDDIISLYGIKELDVLDTPVRQVTVSFAPGYGGTGEMESITVSEGEPFPVPACEFTHPSGSFVHWISGSRIITGETMTADDDITLTAVWNNISNLAVVLRYYDLSRGAWKEQSSYQLYYGDPYVFPEPLGNLPDNYTFLRWQGSQSSYQSGEYFTVDGNYTFSGIWIKTPDNGISWSVSGDTLSVSGQGTVGTCEGSDGMYGGIFLPWYAEKDTITSLSVGEGISSVGSYAFYGLDIVNASLPDTLASIGNSAFANCAVLSDISFPAGLKTIGDYAFSNCSDLCGNSISLKNTSVTRIGKNAFYGCEPSYLWFPVTLEEIGENAADQTNGCQIIYAGSPTQWAAITIHPNNPVIFEPDEPITYMVPDAVSFSLSPNPLTLAAGSTCPLELTDISPSNGYYRLVWASSDETVASVSETGIVTAVRTGTAVITASFNGFTASASVVVPCIHQLEAHEEITPSCTEPGVAAYWSCPVCGKLFSDENAQEEIETPVGLPALGHDIIGHYAKAPSCTEIGWNAYDTCSRCDYSTYEEIAPLGHDIAHHDAQAPTCTAAGWEAYDSCSRCDYTTYSEIAALGHDLVHHEGISATCTETGWDAYDTCSRCD